MVGRGLRRTGGVMAVLAYLCLGVQIESAKAWLRFDKLMIEGVPYAYDIATADFNGDGKADLALTRWEGNEAVVFLGKGDGTFPISTPLATGVHPNNVATGDFDGDGDMDLAITNGGGGQDVTLLWNQGNGTDWTAAALDVGRDADLNAVVAGRFTSDGHLDLAVFKNSSSTNGYLEIWAGDGDGGFSEGVNVSTGNNPIFAIAGDVNEDSNVDIVVANWGDNSLTILLGDGDGGFSGASGSPIEVGVNPRTVALGDVNGDGHLDLVVANYGDSTISILLGSGDGNFTPATSIESDGNTSGVVVADFDGDGKSDLAVARLSADRLSVYRGNGDGTFGATPLEIHVGDEPGLLVVSDFNGDGKPDLAVANHGSGSVSLLLNRGGWVCEPPPQGLKAWWKGEDNALDSMGDNDGSGTDLAYTDGKVGRAFDFNGTSAYLAVQDSEALNVEDGLTLAAWIFPTNTSLAGVLRKLNQETNGSYGLYILDEKLHFQINGNALDLASNTLIPADTWTHIAVTYDQTAGKAEIYINGVLDQSADYSEAVATSPESLLIGRYGVDPDAYFDGLIDEVQFYERALTAEAIAALFSADEAGTCNPDREPEPFAFVDQLDVARGTQVISNNFIVSGIDYETPIAIVSCTGIGCAYSINDGDWRNTPATVENGDSVRVRQTSSSNWSTTTDLTLAIGGATDTFSVKTKESGELAVEKPGTGTGTVTSSPTGIDCGADCEEIYASGTWITLTAVPGPDSVFQQWIGCDEVSGNQCMVQVNGETVVQAHFEKKSYVISSAVDGGKGELVCTTPVTHGSDSVCRMIPAAGYALASLRDNGTDVFGAVSHNSYTIAEVTEDHEVTATFSPLRTDGPDLTVQWTIVGSRLEGRLARGTLKTSNIGNAVAGPSKVSLFLSSDGVNPEIPVRTLTVPRLRPNHSRNWSVAYRSKTSLAGLYLIAVVDAANQVLETDEGNNAAFCRIP